MFNIIPAEKAKEIEDLKALEEYYGPQEFGRNARRAYVFTCFNEKLDGIIDWDNSRVKRGVINPEVCPRTGRKHWQGFIRCHKPTTFKRIIADVLGNTDRVWFDKQGAVADDITNLRYCSKPNEFYPDAKTWGTHIQWGDWEDVGQGRRNDIKSFVEKMIKGEEIADVALSGLDEAATFIKYPRGLTTYQNMIIDKIYKHKRRNVDVVVCYGPTGTGKSSFAARFDDYYRLPPLEERKQAWFSNYAGEKILWIDEFKGQIPLQILLQWVDVWPLEVQTKGGFVRARWETVIICSNFGPGDWYPEAKDVEKNALLRRVTHLYEFEKLGNRPRVLWEPKAPEPPANWDAPYPDDFEDY